MKQSIKVSQSLENASSLRERFETSLAALRECSRVLLVEQALSDTVSDEEEEDEGEKNDNEKNLDGTIAPLKVPSIHHSSVAGVLRSPISPRRIVARQSTMGSTAVKNVSDQLSSDSVPILYPSLSPSTVARRLHIEAERMRLVLQEMSIRDREGIAREMQIQGIFSTGTGESSMGCAELSSIDPIVADATSSSPESRTVRPLVRSILADLHGVANSLPTLRLLETKNSAQKTAQSIIPGDKMVNDGESEMKSPLSSSSSSFQTLAPIVTTTEESSTETTPNSLPTNTTSDQMIKRRPSLNPHFEWLRSRMRAVQQQPTPLQVRSSTTTTTTTTTTSSTTQETHPPVNSIIQSADQMAVVQSVSSIPPSSDSLRWIPVVRIRGSSFHHDEDNGSLAVSSTLSSHINVIEINNQELPVDADELSFIANSHHDQQEIAVPGDAVDTSLSFTPSTAADGVGNAELIFNGNRRSSTAVSLPLSSSISSLPPLAGGPTSSLAERAARVLHSSRQGSRSSSRRNSFQSGDALLPDSLHYSVGSAGSTRRNSLVMGNADNLLFRRNSIAGAPTMTETATQTTTLINESRIMSASGRRFSTTELREPSETELIPSSIDNVAHVLRAAFVNARQSVAAVSDGRNHMTKNDKNVMKNEKHEEEENDESEDEEEDEDTSVLRTLSSQSGMSKGLQHYLYPSLHPTGRQQALIAKQPSPVTVLPPPVPLDSPFQDKDDDDDDDFALSVLNGPSIGSNAVLKPIEFGWYVRENAPLSPQPIMVQPRSDLKVSQNVESQGAISISAFMGFEEEEEVGEEERGDDDYKSAAHNMENVPPMVSVSSRQMLSSTTKRPITATGSRMQTTTSTKSKKTKKVKARKISTAVPLSARPAWRPNGS